MAGKYPQDWTAGLVDEKFYWTRINFTITELILKDQYLFELTWK